MINGPFIVNWVDRGTRNHIIHLAKWVMVVFISNEGAWDSLVFINHAIRNPAATRMSGIILIGVGRIKGLFDRSVSHLIALPAAIDIDARRIVG